MARLGGCGGAASRSGMIACPPDSEGGSVAAALRRLDRHFAPLARATQEVAILAYLDPEWRVLGMRHVAAGGAASLALSLRTVVADAIAFDAVAVAMAHNHPSGDPTPSAADYQITRRLAVTLDAIGVRLVEHVVLARGGCDRFRARGLL